MEIPNNIPVDPSMTTGAGAVKKVSENSAKAGTGQSSKIQGNGTAAVSPGTHKAAIGQLFAEGNINSPNNFYRVEPSINESNTIQQHPIIDGQLKVFLPEDSNPATTAAFKKLDDAAHAAEERLPQTSKRVLPPEILSAGAAIMPLDGADYPLRRVLELAARASGIPIGINTAEATERLVQLFYAQPD
jgi:hypothetical protein